MDRVIIRTAKQGDLASLLSLYRSLNPRDPAVDAAKAAEAWSSLLGGGWASVFVAEMDGSLAASCVIVIIPNLTRGARPFGVIENVVTHPEYRRLGLGRSVLEAALATAWDRDCYKVMLATGRAEAVPFYERVGFKRSGKTFLEIRR